MTSGAVPPATDRANRWGRWLLLASLAVNMFMGGVLVAQQTYGPPPPPPGPLGPVQHMIDQLSRVLPPADTERLQQVVATHRGRLMSMRDNMEMMRMRLRVILSTEPFDANGFVAALEGQREFDNERIAPLLRDAAVAIAAMSPEGRRKLAEFHDRPPPPPFR